MHDERAEEKAPRRRIHPVVWLAAGAVALRLALFLGRGDYVAYDEAWYLHIGQSLWDGRGFRLSGLRHVTLSPLFPILAGAVDRLLGDPIWAGRIVAAVASGLIVLPCWSIFRRLAGRRTALLGCGIVAVLPSLAPFVAPYWVGWDMFVGAEPLLHLLLFTGIALYLRALDRGRAQDWALAGATFALAYLARPEAIVIFGLLGLITLATVAFRRRPGALPVVMAGALAFVLVALPYWVYLHDATGRWTLTGRGVQVELPGAERRQGDGRLSSEVTIERMLWRGEHGRYVRRLYALAPSGTRLRSTYWGVPRSDAASDAGDGSAETDGTSVDTAGPVTGPASGSTADPGDDATTVERAPSTPARGADAAAGPAGAGGSDREPDAARLPPPTDDRRSAGAAPTTEPDGALHGFVLYARSLEMIVPWFLLPFLALGAFVPGRTRRLRLELPVAGALVATSVLIARLVAIDPRTQAFLAPLLAFYTARGLRFAGTAFDRRVGGEWIRRGFAATILPAVALVVLLGTDARRLYMATTVGSLHQLGATENRRAGEVLRGVVPEGESLMSWHPSVALHARRDWRVLPIGSFPEIVRYANAIDCEFVVLSFYNPSPLENQQFPRPYIVLRVPPGVPMADRWTIEVDRAVGNVAVGRLAPS